MHYRSELSEFAQNAGPRLKNEISSLLGEIDKENPFALRGKILSHINKWKLSGFHYEALILVEAVADRLNGRSVAWDSAAEITPQIAREYLRALRNYRQAGVDQLARTMVSQIQSFTPREFRAGLAGIQDPKLIAALEELALRVQEGDSWIISEVSSRPVKIEKIENGVVYYRDTSTNKTGKIERVRLESRQAGARMAEEISSGQEVTLPVSAKSPFLNLTIPESEEEIWMVSVARDGKVTVSYAPNATAALRKVAIDETGLVNVEGLVFSVKETGQIVVKNLREAKKEEPATPAPAVREGAAGMTRREFADWLINNRLDASGPAALYDLLVRRPELRGLTEEELNKKLAEEEDAYRRQGADYKESWDQSHATNWDAYLDTYSFALNRDPNVDRTKNPKAHIRPERKGNEPWLRFIMRPLGTSTAETKLYLTLRDVVRNLTPARLNDFLSALVNAGFEGELKIPAFHRRARTAFDNVVIHANDKNLRIAEGVARKMFEGELILDGVSGALIRGEDKRGDLGEGTDSATRLMADEVDQKRKSAGARLADQALLAQSTAVAPIAERLRGADAPAPIMTARGPVAAPAPVKAAEEEDIPRFLENVGARFPQIANPQITTEEVAALLEQDPQGQQLLQTAGAQRDILKTGFFPFPIAATVLFAGRAGGSPASLGLFTTTQVALPTLEIKAVRPQLPAVVGAVATGARIAPVATALETADAATITAISSGIREVERTLSRIFGVAPKTRIELPQKLVMRVRLDPNMTAEEINLEKAYADRVKASFREGDIRFVFADESGAPLADLSDNIGDLKEGEYKTMVVGAQSEALFESARSVQAGAIFTAPRKAVGADSYNMIPKIPAYIAAVLVAFDKDENQTRSFIQRYTQSVLQTGDLGLLKDASKVPSFRAYPSRLIVQPIKALNLKQIIATALQAFKQIAASA
jgi:hypothetical protein